MKKKHIDYFLFISVIIISIFGIIMIYSASSIWSEFKYQDAFKYVKQQGLFFLVGIFVMIISSKISLDFLKRKANLILMGCFLLLVSFWWVLCFFGESLAGGWGSGGGPPGVSGAPAALTHAERIL